MGRIYTEESKEVIEMSRWEQFPSQWTPGSLKPGNPYKYRPFPKMLYKAQQLPNGKWAISMEPPSRFGFPGDAEWGAAIRAAESFGTSCQMVVNSEAEMNKARSEGWCEGPGEALAFHERLESDIGKAAAERNWQDRNMSDKAKAESKAHEAETFGHVPEIPRKPGKRGRKARAQV